MVAFKSIKNQVKIDQKIDGFFLVLILKKHKE